MNKIFKVLWNRSRGVRVVTNETKTACGKGRQEATVATDVRPSSIDAVTLLFAIGLLGTGLSVPAIAATEISRPAGWNQTTITANGNRYDIHTEKFVNNNKTGINRFDKFSLDAGNIANLHLNNASGTISADRLLNFVNQQIKVDGTVNAVKDGKIGGDLIFVSPQGMAVGSTGVINAGSFTAVAPTQDEYETWTGALGNSVLEADLFTDSYWSNLQSGDVPLNPNAVITVAGSINAGNRIALSAAKIELKDNALVKTGVDNFSQLVNIENADGSVSVSAGLLEEDLTFSVDPKSGDIVLVARADEKAAGNTSSGSGDLAPVHAVISVGQKAKIEAAGNVKVLAEAGNTTYDFVNKTWVAKEGQGSTKVSASVTIDGTIAAGKDIDVQANAYNMIDHSSLFTIKALGEQFLGSVLGPFVGHAVEYVDMGASSSLTVNEHALLAAKKNLSLTAKTDLELAIGDSTAWKNYSNLLPEAKSLPIAAIAVAKADASSTLTIKGTARAGSDLSLKANTDFKADVSTTATMQGTSNPQASFVYADFDSKSTLTVDRSAEIGALENQTVLGKTSLESKTTNKVKTSAETYVTAAGNIGLAVNYTDFSSDSILTLKSGLDGTANSLTINAENLTETLTASSKTDVGDTGLMMKLQAKISDVAFNKIAQFAGKHGASVDGTVTDSSFNGGGAITVVTNRQSSKALVDPGQDEKFNASKDISIASAATLKDHRYEAATTSVIDEEQGNQQTNKQGALAIVVATSGSSDAAASELTIADNAAIESVDGKLELSSTVLIEQNRRDHLIEEIEARWKQLTGYFVETDLKPKLAEFEDQKNKMVTAFKAVTSGQNSTDNFKQLLSAMVEFGKLVVDTFGVAGSAVSPVIAGAKETAFSILDIVNPAGWANMYVSAAGTSKDSKHSSLSVSGAIGVLNQSSSNTLKIGTKTSLVSGGNLSITADSKNGNVALTGYLDNLIGIPLPTRDNSQAFGASLGYQQLESNNALTISEGADIEAEHGSLTLTANDQLKAIAVTASAGLNSGGTSFSGMVAVTKADGSNTLAIDDEATLDSAGAMTIDARRDDLLETIAGALGKTSSDEGGSVAVGAGIAVNLGGVDNKLEIKDNDSASSTINYGAGHLVSSAGTLTLTADTTVNANAIGVAGEAATTTHKDLGEQLDNLPGEEVDGDAFSADEIENMTEVAAGQNGDDTYLSDLNWLFNEDNSSAESASELPTLPDTSVAELSPRTINIAAAGSIGWNQFNQNNSLTIQSSASDPFSLKAQSLSIEALSNKWIGAFAGAAALSITRGGNTTSNVGIGGSGAVNRSDFVNAIGIDGLKITAQDTSVKSLVNGTTVAEGLGLAVAAGQSQTALGIDAGISANLVTNEVTASVKNLNYSSSDDGDHVYDQTAWSGETQVTGGTAVGVAAGGGTFSGAFGVSIAVAKIKNTIGSEMSDSNLSDLSNASVRALASLTQVNTAVGANVAVSSETAGAASGSILYADITNNVNAQADRTTLTVADGGTVEIAARTAGTGNGQEAHDLAQRAKGVDGVLTREKLLNRDALEGITLYKDKDKKESVDVKGEFVDGSKMSQVSVAIGVGVAVGSQGGGSGSAAILVSDFDNRFTAKSDTLTVKTDTTAVQGIGFTQIAATDVSTVNVAAGVAAAATGETSFGVAGSLILGGIEQTAESTATGLTLTPSQSEDSATVKNAVSATNEAKTVNVAGNASAAVGESGAGIGAAFVSTGVENNAIAGLDSSTINGTGMGDFVVNAHNNAQTWDAAVNGSVAANAAVGGSVVLNRLANNAQAHIKGSMLTGLGGIDINAKDESQAWTLAGAVSVNYEEGASVSGGIGITLDRGATEAKLEDSSIESKDAATDISVEAHAKDKVMTMTLGVSAAPGGVGITTASAKNKIDRTVTAQVRNVNRTQQSGALGTLTIKSESRATIGNLGIMAGGGNMAGVGVGFGFNTIDIDVSSVGEKISNFEVDTIEVGAVSANDINSIGVGGAGAMNTAVAGSATINNISGDVTARLAGTSDAPMLLQHKGAAAIYATSDDTVGTYAGQVVGAGTAAVGLNIGVTDHSVNTTAELDYVTLNRTGDSGHTLAVKGGVDDDAINSDVVEDVSIGKSLETDRDDVTVSGTLVSATSTTTYKTLVINGGGASSAEVSGTANAVTHGGTTTASVRNSSIDSGTADIGIFAGDYANFFTSLTTVGGAMTFAGDANVSVVQTKHATKAELTQDSIITTDEDASIQAEGKEGVSAMTITAAVAGSGALGASAAVTNLHSSVETDVRTNSTLTAARSYLQDANYLGRISNLGITGAGTLAGAGAVSVAINNINNRVASHFRATTGATLTLHTDSAQISAERTTGIKLYGASAAVAVQGVAGAAFVGVNTVDGESEVTVQNADIRKMDAQGQSQGAQRIGISAENKDTIDIVEIGVGAGAYGGAGASVVVNRIHDAARVNVNKSALAADTLEINAGQNRTVDGTLVMVTGGLIGGIAANVVATEIGEPTGNESIFGDAFPSGSADDPSDEVSGYQDKFGSVTTEEILNRAKKTAEGGAQGASADTDAPVSAGPTPTKGLTGTHVALTDTTIVSEPADASKKGSVSITANEDTDAGAGVNVTLGSGSGGAASLAASVATLTRHSDAAVSIENGGVRSDNITIESRLGAVDKLKLYQGSLGIVAGSAVYGETKADGQASVEIKGGTYEARQTTEDDKGTLTINAADNRSSSIESLGVEVAVGTAGAVISKINDSTAARVRMDNTAVKGTTSLSAQRTPVSTAHSKAGYFGGITGVGAVAEITDSGTARTEINNVTAEDYVWKEEEDGVLQDRKTSIFGASVVLKPTISVTADSYGGSGFALGIVEAKAVESGKAELEVRGGQLSTHDVSLLASAGRDTDNSADALHMTSLVKGYGGAGLGVQVNTGSLTNNAEVKLKTDKVNYSSDTTVDIDAEGHAEYSLESREAAGEVISSDNSALKLGHGVKTSVTMVGKADETKAKDIDVKAHNTENAVFNATSAGGSVIAIDVDAIRLEHNDTSSTSADISGKWLTAEDMRVSALTDRDVAFHGRNTKGDVAGGSGAGIVNSMTGATAVTLADNTEIESGGTLELLSDSKWTIKPVQEGENAFALISANYGAVAGSTVSVSNTQTSTASVTVGKNAKLISAEAMTFAAKTTGATALRVQSLTAGAAAGVGTSATHNIHVTDTVNIGEGASLRTTTSAGNITLSASGDETYELAAVGNVRGAAGGGSTASLTLTYARDNSVDIAKNASVHSGRDVNLYAGRDVSGADASLDFHTYTHAYNHSLIAPVSSKITDAYAFTNSVSVNEGATVLSTADTKVAAILGDLTSKKEARYYNWTSGKTAGNVEMVTSGSGEIPKGTTQQSNAVTLDGEILAGVNTAAKVTIDGVVLHENDWGLTTGEDVLDSPIVTVNEGEQTEFAESIRDGIEIGTDENANEYWDRHMELQRLIQEYSGLGTDNGSILAAYMAEDEALINVMLDKGYATRSEDGAVRAATSVDRGYVLVDNITVSGGNVSFTTGTVSGKGAVKANSATGITIENNSNLALKIGDLEILNVGGNVTMNDVAVMPGQSTAGFDVANVATNPTADKPVIDIASNLGDSITYTGKDGSETVTRTIKPDTSVILTGNIVNAAGDVTIHSASDLFQHEGSTISAAGNVDLSANGTVTQAYSSGITNIGGNVEDQWTEAREEIDKKIAENYDQNNYAWNNKEVQGGSIIAGGDVIISGEMININGTVQSGYSSYQLDLSGDALERIKTVTDNWVKNGSKQNIDVKSAAYLISEGGYVDNKDGTYSYRVAAWYDPVNERIVLDDINPQGGHVYITGRIASTGNGNIYVANGSADIKVDVGDYDVLTGVVDTGNIAGRVRITDTNYKSYGDRKASAMVTEWSQNQYGNWYLDEKGERIEDSIIIRDHNSNTFGYDPVKGTLYSWSWGYQTGTVGRVNRENHFTWWRQTIWDKNTEPDQSEITLTELGKDMLEGTTFIQSSSEQTNQAQGIVQTVKEYKSDWQWVEWRTYDDALHWGGTDHLAGTRTESSQKIVTFTVKADYGIGGKLIEGSNSIDIKTGGTLLLGNRVSATEGKVTLTAGNDILSATGHAVINGASELSMSAGGSIGEADNAIALSGGNEQLIAKISAGNNIYIEGSRLTNSAVKADLTAGDAVGFTSSADLVATVKASDIALTSTQGSIKADVEQIAKLDSSQRFDATAAKDISVTVGEGKGNLGLGKVESTEGNVLINLEEGTVFDAIDRSEETALTAEERIALWKDLGLIGENGEDIGEQNWKSDMQKAEAAVVNDYERYEAYKSQDNLTDEQKADFASLTERFAAYGSAEAAVEGEKADESTNLGKLARSADNYDWTQDELLYSIAESIVNPDPGDVPVAGEPNIIGKQITVNSVYGGLGVNSDSVTGELRTQSGEINTEILKLLAQADVDDVDWNADGTVTVELKQPVTVKADKFQAETETNVFVQSSADTALKISRVIARNGAVRLASANGVYGVDSIFGIKGEVKGSSVAIRGGSGGIGTSDTPLHVTHAADGWLALSSADDIFVTSDSGDLTLYSVSGGSDVTLTASNLYAFAGKEVDFGDDVLDFSTMGYLSAGKDGEVILNVTGNIGTETTALRVDSDEALVFNNPVENVWLHTVGTGGSLDLVNLDAAQNIGVQATGDVSLTGKAAAGEALTVVSFEGDITLSNADVKTPGTLTVTAVKGNVDISGIAATDEGLSAGEIFITAGDELMLGPDPVKVSSTEGSLTIKAGRLDDNAVKSGSNFNAAEALTIAVADNLTVGGEGVTMTGNNISVSSTESTLRIEDGTVIEARQTASVSGHEGAYLQGDVLVTGKTAEVTSEEGGIELAGNVKLGGKTADDDQANVVLTARDDIVQQNALAEGGIHGNALTAKSEAGSILLDAPLDDTAGSSGNTVTNANLEAAENIAFGTSRRDVTITVNESTGGELAGSLKVHADNAGVTLANNVTTGGDVLINAAAVHGDSLTAGGTLGIVSALYDDSIAEGELRDVVFTGSLTGNRVTVYTDKGNIHLAEVNTTEGYLDVYRLSQTEKGTVTIDGGVSEDSTMILNHNGDVNITEPYVGEDSIIVLTGHGGQAHGQDQLKSESGTILVRDHAQKFGSLLTLEGLRQILARDLSPDDLPHLELNDAMYGTAGRAVDANIVAPFGDFDSPTDPYFFMHLRTDAQSAKDEEEESSLTLENGLPASPKAIIIDHRIRDPHNLWWMAQSVD